MSLTKKEKLYLKENFQTTTNVELAKFLNYHPKSILMVLNRLKLKRTPEEIKNILSKTPVNKILLTGEELDYLKSNYNCLSNVKLSKKFKVSTKTIQRILLSLNLHRSKGEQLHLILMSRSKMEIENSKRSIF